ncbi:hypothetical protein QAD02_004494 [Eretmocerus hayati]|uniref:Uncharacterized protein n=1 Tax=Eretmocerus hayati TaxID=131215 RepID=A0ACC2NQ46_9HYME|nr:hypothetical protein QAD02_004494 [Eretmocerus hayati]
MSKLLISILTTLIAFILCGLNFFSNAEPLSGTNLSAEEKFPFAVLIVEIHKNSDKNDHACVGTVISRNQILTAASCLENRSLSNLRALLSVPAGPVSRLKTKVKIASKTTFNDFVNQAKSEGTVVVPLLSDIAILELDVPDAEIDPVQISYSTDLPSPDIDIKIVGFGKPYADKSSILKKYGTVRILPKYQCNELAEKVSPNYKKLVWANHIYCAQNSLKSVLAIDGDFGGPALGRNNELIGITFRGRPTNEKFRIIRKQQPNLIINIASDHNFMEFDGPEKEVTGLGLEDPSSIFLSLIWIKRCTEEGILQNISKSIRIPAAA